MYMCGVGVLVVAAALFLDSLVQPTLAKRPRRILPVFLQESQKILDVSTEGPFVPC